MTVEELRSCVREKLPEFMMPDFRFVALLPKHCPLTPNGKVDRRALPAPQTDQRDLDSGFVNPRAGLETEVADVWSEVLGLKMIGATDNFFELGGHLLLANTQPPRAPARERSTLNCLCPVLFETPTVGGLRRLRWTRDRWKAERKRLFRRWNR